LSRIIFYEIYQQLLTVIIFVSYNSSNKTTIIIIIIIIKLLLLLLSASQLFANLGRKISSASGDDREGAFLFHRVSVLVQRYNAVFLHDTLPATDCAD